MDVDVINTPFIDALHLQSEIILPDSESYITDIIPRHKTITRYEERAGQRANTRQWKRITFPKWLENDGMLEAWTMRQAQVIDRGSDERYRRGVCFVSRGTTNAGPSPGWSFKLATLSP